MQELLFFTKKIIFSVLPESLNCWIRKRHYYKSLRQVNERESDLDVIEHLVEPGGIVFDIGANIGFYTKYLSQLVGYSGAVYSFEPLPTTFDILKFNVYKLKLENVTLFNKAVSDSHGKVIMEVPYDSSGRETHYRAAIVNSAVMNKKSKRVEVQTISLDTEFSSIAERVCFVKCDVEGHESICIKGAVDFIKKGEAAWMVEISGDPDQNGSSARQVLNIFDQFGYSVWWYDGQFLNRRKTGDNSINYFFLLPKHVEILKDRNHAFFK